MGKIVWLASYPKSGNTWLRLLLRALMDDLDAPTLLSAINDFSIASNREVFERVTGLVSSELHRDEADRLRPFVYRQLAKAESDLLWLKVHDRYESAAVAGVDFPAEQTHAVVYLVRDPRDVCVSFAHHLGLSVQDTMERMLTEKLYLDSAAEPLSEQLPQWLGRWDRHVSGWLDQGVMPPILLRYEDLLADPVESLGVLAERLGLRASAERIACAVERCRFDRLAKAEQTHGFAERPDRSTRFFRSGKAGDWVGRLSKDQAARIVREFAPTMDRLGYAAD